ncbi:MAG: NTP transferase domain-containing protein [Synergistaceae bacterium]|jgi:CTP:molybdopterin cytidylyltransferase MocA|nr:NTP transferase domain-containing protein [Synergistaceae bacterium]
MKRADGEIAGIILAGGFAKRMGVCKPLLPVPKSSALETAAARMKKSGVSEIIVVVGHDREKIIREAKKLKCRPVCNLDYESGMFSSVVAGIRALPPQTEAFYLLPADIPLVKPATYRSLAEAFCENYETPEVVYPAFMGKRGHPPLIGRAMIEPILAWEGERGLAGFFDGQPHRSLDIPTGDRATILDMDTPEDYQKLLAYSKTEFFPDEEECAELLGIAGTPEKVARHGRAVADCAMRIAGALGRPMDRRLLLASCLLHDLAKGSKDHEEMGARWLRRRGYSKVAEIVASHKDLASRKKIGEAEILYLADKLTDGTAVSTLESRMSRMEARFPRGSEALAGAKRRIGAAAKIQKKIEAESGMTLGQILEV